MHVECRKVPSWRHTQGHNLVESDLAEPDLVEPDLVEPDLVELAA